MRQLLISDGKVEKVDEVDRGLLLLYDKKEWMRRSLPEQKAFERTFLIPMVGWFCLAIFEIALVFFLSNPIRFDRLPIIFLWFLLSGLYALQYFHLWVRNRNPVAVPGIYENGIQLLHRTFLPYGEIGKVERKVGRFMTWKKRDLVHLNPRVEPASKYLTVSWKLPVDFLGPAGMACLKERLEISRGLKVGVPELILYGPDGTKTVERGMGPANGDW